MRLMKFVLGVAVAVALTACGGGGGSAGTTSGGSTPAASAPASAPVVITSPTISIGLKNSAGTTVTTVSASDVFILQATVKDSAGTALLGQLVRFAGDSMLVKLSGNGSGVTDSNGVAFVQISPATITSSGAGLVTADVSVAGVAASQSSMGVTVVPLASAASSTISLGLAGGGNAISASGLNALATVKDASGTAVGGKLVTFTGDTTLIKFSPANGQVLSDPLTGIAAIQVSPVSLSSAGASTLVAKTTVGTTSLTTSFDFQLSAANLGLGTLNVGIGTLAAYGNRPVSVTATVNGTAATNTPVQVTFNASCGTVTPSVVVTDAAGAAISTYTASLPTCSGTNVTITASAVGATPVSGTIGVDGSIATNVQFVSTTPQLIYLADSVGTTQAQVAFKVVDSSGNPLQNKKLRLSLSNTATGVSLNTVGNTAAVDMTTDSLGLVSAAVFSGTVPTSLNLKATLLDGNGAVTNVFSNSNLLTVASGRPTQSSLSLSLEKFSIEAANVDGETSKVTLSMADRQGNPVPPGTQVNFVTEAGVMLPAVCFVPPVIPATASSPAIPVSSCSVTLKASGTRTKNGRVSILAYVTGEEDFIDLNGNNIFDGNDTFTDLGRAYRDDNGQTAANGYYSNGEFQVPRVGAAACTVTGNLVTECPGDGVWGAADVRKQTMVVFASGTAKIVGTLVPPLLTVTIGDLNDNSVPTGSTITARTSSVSCGLNGTISTITKNVANSIDPVTINYATSVGCASADQIFIEITTPLPSAIVTTKTFVFP
ncbi:MAG: hypothetical protein WCG50_05925 [Rhodoferax sp.]|uniref:hypothetical protein n=1 Tax=Rhodoferax sp. TaxID=50421 RepID=UPI003016C290